MHGLLARPRAQFSLAARGPDLSSMSRVIHVVGRLVLILDEDMRAMRRAWCVWEVWAALRHKRALLTLSTPSALAPQYDSPRFPGKPGSPPVVLPPIRSSGGGPGAPSGPMPVMQRVGTAASAVSIASTADPLSLSMAIIDEPVNKGPPPIPNIDLNRLYATVQEDKDAIYAAWRAEVASHKNRTTRCDPIPRAKTVPPLPLPGGCCRGGAGSPAA
jgi:hypothetical protein